jgi:hypothetical protein
MGSLNSTPSASAGMGGVGPDIPRQEVLAELDRILESHHFHTSKKCSRFLRHIVVESLEGRFEGLKERTLGVSVFDREPHYDTNQDPIVRGTAGEVRKRLAQYYLEAGHAELRFSLPPGSYIPDVHYLRPEPRRAPSQPVHPKGARRFSKARSGMALAVTALAGCALLITSGSLLLQPRPLDRFWTPMIGGNSVLVCMGQPAFYIFRPDTARALNSWFANEPLNRQGAPPMTSVPLGEIVPMWNRSVALADAQAFSRLANFLAHKGKQVDLRGERLVTLNDLRGRPSVFIGAFDNDWTISFAGDLRFYFDTDQQTHTQIIRDRQRPAATDWKLVDAWPPGKDISQDYALVTRVVSRTTERSVVIIGGISQYGTEAAAEFATDPTYFDHALAQAPSNWYRKNIQVVLSTQVLSGVSGPPTVAATYFW